MAMAYSYIRFSSRRQADGDSERRQSEAFDRYCKEHQHQPASLNFRDVGVSAFKGKNASQGALAAFAKAVEESAIAKGSLLVCECLDRLSRLEPLDAIDVLRDIINAGITVVTLTDHQVYSRESLRKNPAQLFILTAVFMRAHEESQTKSMRVRAAHAQARKALSSTSPFNHRCPNWISWNEQAGRFLLIPERCEVVRRMIRMSLDGYGTPTIAKTLNREGVPLLSFKSTSRNWEYSTIRHILMSRTLIGEYQPKQGENGKRVAVGDPVKGYYPALITEDEFYRLQHAMAARSQSHIGRNGKSIANLFGRVLVSGHDNGTMTIQRKQADSCTMVSMNAVRGLSKHTAGFSYPAFEAAFLHWVTELDPQRLGMPAQVDRAAEIEGRIADRTARQAAIEKEMVSGDISMMRTLVGAANRVEAEIKSLSAELEVEKAKRTSSPVTGAAIGELADRMDKLTGDAKAALRSRIKSAIAALCKTIRVYVYGNTVKRIAFAHVLLASGGDRVFQVVCERGKAPVTLSDNQAIGLQQPTEFTAALFSRWADEELRKAA
jgi:DNA invertase Pin-like site-specific DNA recombinase